MSKYTVYFELYGKKMKTTVEAENEEQAKNKITNKIKFYKVELKEGLNEDLNNDSGFISYLSDILNPKK